MSYVVFLLIVIATVEGHISTETIFIETEPPDRLKPYLTKETFFSKWQASLPTVFSYSR